LTDNIASLGFAEAAGIFKEAAAKSQKRKLTPLLKENYKVR
jgi:hypothetical protein